MRSEYSLSTPKAGFYNITPQVREAIANSEVTSGIAVVFCLHTTASIIINESADPDVRHDLMLALDNAFPDLPAFRHAEGNSPAHIKASVLGTSITLIVENNKPLLGTWQCIYFCELDPPRSRKFFVKVVGE